MAAAQKMMIGAALEVAASGIKWFQQKHRWYFLRDQRFVV
jgi:hypothetical protein